MKYLIVGLGNIGPEYHGTRHNIGFDVLDELAKEFEVVFETKRLGDVASFKHKGRTFILLKPSTYVNLSGKSVHYWKQKEKILRDNLLVVLDDLNLPFGKLRTRGSGNHGGHNGLRNIEEVLGGANYPRLRLGIGAEYSDGKQINFVLGTWSDEEKELLPSIFENATGAIKCFGLEGITNTMNKFNKK